MNLGRSVGVDFHASGFVSYGTHGNGQAFVAGDGEHTRGVAGSPHFVAFIYSVGIGYAVARLLVDDISAQLLCCGRSDHSKEEEKKG